MLQSVLQIGTVSVDASLHEIHSMSGEAPDHPVETGSSISEHYIRNPRRFRVEGIITNQPLEVPQTQAVGVQKVDKEFSWTANPQVPLVGELGGGGLIGMAIGAIASATGINQHTGVARGFEPEFDRVQDAYLEIESLMELGDPIDIITSLRIYHNMVIESFDVDRDKNSGRALKFSATVKQVRTVETEYAARVPTPLVERGKPNVNRGKQSGRSVSPGSTAADAAEAAAGNQSMAAAIFL